ATAAASSYTGSAARWWCHMRTWSCAHRDVVGDLLSAAYERFLHPPARAMQEGVRRRFPPERPVLRGEGNGGVATEVAKNASSIGHVNLAHPRSKGGRPPPTGGSGTATFWGEVETGKSRLKAESRPRLVPGHARSRP